MPGDLPEVQLHRQASVAPANFLHQGRIFVLHLAQLRQQASSDRSYRGAPILDRPWSTR